MTSNAFAHHSTTLPVINFDSWLQNESGKGGAGHYGADDEAVSVCPLPTTFDSCLHFSQRRVREHMVALTPEDDWLQDAILPGELEAWNPQLGPCYTSDRFKLNLKGTPRDDWNISASKVFTDDFLVTHSDSYQDTWQVAAWSSKKPRCISRICSGITGRNSLVMKLLFRRRLQRRRERNATVNLFSAAGGRP